MRQTSRKHASSERMQRSRVALLTNTYRDKYHYWEAARACPTLVPVLSLGRRVLASEGAGSLAGTFLLSAPAVAAGGPQLRDLSLSSELFKASSMQAVVSISKLEYQ